MKTLKDWSLDGKLALVAGASRGIGRACAIALAQLGANVIGIARKQTELESLNESLSGDGHIMLVSDLSTSDGVQKLMNELDKTAFPDIVVANLYVRKEPARLISGEFVNSHQCIEKNMDYLEHLLPVCLKHQRQKNFGRWIAIGSLSAELGSPGQSSYVMQKNALLALMRTLAVEEGKYNITANVVVPGFIDTPGTQKNYTEKIRKKLSQMNVIGRAGNAAEVAHAVAFLASPGASYITGTSLKVCGGTDLGWAFLK